MRSQDTARTAVIALPCAFGARRAGTGHHAQLETTTSDQRFEPCSRATRKLVLTGAARQRARLRSIKTDQTDRASAHPDCVAIDNCDRSGINRIPSGWRYWV